MYRFQERIRSAVLGIRLDWRIKFILFATALASIEEAIRLVSQRAFAAQLEYLSRRGKVAHNTGAFFRVS